MYSKKSANTNNCNNNSNIFINRLKKEFKNIDEKCLTDIIEHFDYDYDSIREILNELYNIKPQNDQNIDDSESLMQYYNGQQIYLPITNDIFDNLHCIFETTRSTTTKFKQSNQTIATATTIREDLRMKDIIYLPINLDLAYDIYWNLLNYIQNANDHLDMIKIKHHKNDTNLFMINNNNDDDDDFNNINNNLNDEQLAEIIETEKAIQSSRKEYLEQLVERKRMNKLNDNNNNNDNGEYEALLQEWLLEKKRDFLIKHFPGLDLLKLNHIFESNFFNLNDTINDIEALYDYRLPLYYNKSLYSDIVRNPAKTISRGGGDDDGTKLSKKCTKKKRKKKKIVKSSVRTTVNVIDYDDNDDDDYNNNDNNLNNSLTIKDPNDDPISFANKIKDFIEQRTYFHFKLEYLSKKKIKFLHNNNKIIYRYNEEIRNIHQELRQLSDDIIDTYQNYHFNDNTMDLHHLIINEVRIIVPSVLAAKQDQLLNDYCNDNKTIDLNDEQCSSSSSSTTAMNNVKNNKLEFKIITGIGAGTIRRYLINYLSKKKLTYRMTDGQGSFIITLHANNPIKFF